MDRWDAYAGQVVQMKAPRAGTELVKIVKTNPKKAKVVKENGEQWAVPYSFLHATDADEAATFTLAEPDEQMTLGSIVKWKSGAKPGLYVICGSRAGTYKVAQLGGDAGRYYSSVAPVALEVVKFDVAGV